MSDRSGLLFHACFPRMRPPPEWYNDLLQRLWEHGLRYNSALTWEAAYEEQVRGHVDYGTLEFKEINRLSTLIEHMKTAEYGSVEAGASAISLDLQFSLENRWSFPEGTRLSWISLWTDKYAILPPDDEKSHCQELEYLQSYQAFWEWSAALCTLTNPLYGFGYSFRHSYPEEDPMSVFEQQEAEHILSGDYPAIERIVKPTPVQYLAPALATPERLLAALDTPGTAVKRLRNGGVLLLRDHLPFSYQAGIAHTHLAQKHRKRGDAILKTLWAEGWRGGRTLNDP